MATTADGLTTYANDRGVELSNNSVLEQEAALVRARDYIRYHYVTRFGNSITVDQDIIDAATYEAAIVELGDPGFWTRTYTPDQQKVLVGVGDIKWQVRGDVSGTDAATPVSTRIEAMLRPYMVTYAGALVV